MSGDRVSLPWLTSQAEKILPVLGSLAPSPVFPRPAMAIPLPSFGTAPRQLTRLQVHRTPPKQLLRSLLIQHWPEQTQALLLLYNLDGNGNLSDALTATPFWLGYAFAPDQGQGELCLRLMLNSITGTLQQRPARTAFEASAGAVEA
jgi:hypothetical protein